GMKFKRVGTTDVVRFDGRRFVWTSGTIMEMQVYSPTEQFEVYEEKITLELTQEEVNTLALLMGRSSQRECEEKFERHRQLTGKITSICGSGASYDLYEKLDSLAK
ncbi:hypothetical protein ACQH7H_24255, partial [Escherichia coli]|uniref:hypothetical protein n=1 Tax=Escherichia coli TaxID=562 RepID=UPI003CF4ECA6